MDIVFEVMDRADIPSVKESMEGVIQFNPKQMEVFLSEKQNIAFTAKLDGMTIGLLYGYSLTRLDGKLPQFFIYSVDIIPAYQNKGYGSRFVKYAVDWAKDNGFGESFVPTEKDNPRACKAYEKAGMMYSDNDCDRFYVLEYEG